MCISSERSEAKDAGTAALQEKARFPYLVQEGHNNSRQRRCKVHINHAILTHTVKLHSPINILDTATYKYFNKSYFNKSFMVDFLLQQSCRSIAFTFQCFLRLFGVFLIVLDLVYISEYAD